VAAKTVRRAEIPQVRHDRNFIVPFYGIKSDPSPGQAEATG
jgi:hypothetical protein